jgi:hypothetical protein
MEDTLYACHQYAVRTRISRGQAYICLNEDKCPKVIGNLVTSTPGPYDAEHNKFEEGNQADGLTIYGGDLRSEQNSRSTTIRRALMSTTKNNSLERRNETFIALLRICSDRNLTAEQWDVHFCQGSYTQLETNARTIERKYADHILPVAVPPT